MARTLDKMAYLCHTAAFQTVPPGGQNVRNAFLCSLHAFHHSRDQCGCLYDGHRGLPAGAHQLPAAPTARGGAPCAAAQKGVLPVARRRGSTPVLQHRAGQGSVHPAAFSKVMTQVSSGYPPDETIQLLHATLHVFLFHASIYILCGSGLSSQEVFSY